MPIVTNDNKKIAINTIIINIRMVLVAIIGFITTRYVLKSLGVSDYGLYNVVGGIVTMMSFIGIAMTTTTRRFINVEMGKGQLGNLNKIFNVSLVLHFAFSFVIYCIALSIGLWYIYNFLNIEGHKLSDAIFVFCVSTTVSAVSIINVPFQALMVAFERFKQIALIDLSTTCLKIPMVILLLLYTGNRLRFYAIAICIIMIASLILYYLYCKNNFQDIVKWNFSKDKSLYKEILLFNNYTSMGAFAYLCRAQGSTMVINYFFGTIVNGAYAIAMQIENQILNFVSNVGTAANPQMTQSYSAGNFSRCFDLVCKISRYSALIMLVLCFSLYVEMNFLLDLWLNKTPEGTVIFCKAILISLFVRSLALGVDGLIQATGKVKVYQIIQSSLLVAGIPIAVICFLIGLPPVLIIFAFILTDILRTTAMFCVVCRVSPFNFIIYCKKVYIPIIKVSLICLLYYAINLQFEKTSSIIHFASLLTTIAFTLILCFYIGITKNEQIKILHKIKQSLIHTI